MRLFYLSLLAAVVVCAPASAHRLVPNDGTHDDLATALYVDAPEVSQLFLHAITAENPQFWLTFHRKPGQTTDLQLGIPDIEGEEGYRPALALVGPGLPEPTAGLPFTVPEELGVLVFDSELSTPEEFYERFTGTRSLILREEQVLMEHDGPFYVVLYHPEGEAGKAWVALGTREEFGLADVVGFAETVATVRTFHEVDDVALPTLTRVLVVVSRFLSAILGIFG